MNFSFRLQLQLRKVCHSSGKETSGVWEKTKYIKNNRMKRLEKASYKKHYRANDIHRRYSSASVRVLTCASVAA